MTAQDDGVSYPDRGHHQSSPKPGAARGNTVQQDSATEASSGSESLDPNTDEELTAEVSGPRIHAPWSELDGVCDGCGAPSVSGLDSGSTECEHYHRQIAGGKVGARGKPFGIDSAPAAAVLWGQEGKGGVVAVTSSRKVALGDERSKALARAGAAMLATSSLLLIILLVAW